MSSDRTGSDDPLSLHGVVPPSVTAFDADGSIDRAATARAVRFLVNAGVHGVFPLGTNGEFPLLDRDERRAIVETVVAEVDGEVPVIAGVGAPGTPDTVRSARDAESADADGVVVVTPYYYPIDGPGLVDHYRTVAEAVDVPVYVYHIPKRTGNRIDHEILSEIAAIDGIAGCKDSSSDVGWLTRAIGENPSLSFLVGSDALVYAGLQVGCAGVVSAVANAFPRLVIDCYEAHRAGEEERTRRRQRQIFRVRDALKRGPHMAGVKAALDLRGFDVGPMRAPLRSMPEAEREYLRRTIRSLDVPTADG